MQITFLLEAKGTAMFFPLQQVNHYQIHHANEDVSA